MGIFFGKIGYLTASLNSFQPCGEYFCSCFFVESLNKFRLFDLKKKPMVDICWHLCIFVIFGHFRPFPTIFLSFRVEVSRKSVPEADTGRKLREKACYTLDFPQIFFQSYFFVLLVSPETCHTPSGVSQDRLAKKAVGPQNSCHPLLPPPTREANCSNFLTLGLSWLRLTQLHPSHSCTGQYPSKASKLKQKLW